MRTPILTGLLALIIATPAVAEEPAQSHATISVTQSDFANGRPSSRLQARIELAVQNVCGSRPDNLEHFADIARCRKSIKMDIERQLAALTGSVQMAKRGR